MMYLKREVDFEHPAKGEQHCQGCQHFRPKQQRCELVLGKIEAGDWCKKWEKK